MDAFPRTPSVTFIATVRNKSHTAVNGVTVDFVSDLRNREGVGGPSEINVPFAQIVKPAAFANLRLTDTKFLALAYRGMKLRGTNCRATAVRFVDGKSWIEQRSTDL